MHTSRNQHESAPEAVGRVFVGIAKAANRRLLERYLGDERSFQTYRSLVTAPDDRLDLCVVDEAWLGENIPQLKELKEREEPPFLPVLLVESTAGPSSTHLGSPLIDDVISVPTQKAELDLRIGNLLERRRLSLEVTRESHRNRERFSTLFRTAPDPVAVVTERDLEILEANDQLCKLADMDSASIQGYPLADLPIFPEELTNILREVVADDSSDPSLNTVEISLTNGEARYAELKVSKVSQSEFPDSFETAEGGHSLMVIFRDVTERRNKQESLRRQNERLDEFSGQLAHELRNPLSTAVGYLEMARDDPTDQYLDGMEESLERIDRMIDELLELARSGQIINDPTPVELAAVVDGAWRSVQTDEARLQVTGDLPVVPADRTRMMEVFENLFRNSVEHAGPSVTITVGVLEDSQGFYVEDNGPGFPETVMNAYERGYSSHQERPNIGLPLVGEIISAHRWELTICEAADGGARVEVRF